jgi:hypothetical protein
MKEKEVGGTCGTYGRVEKMYKVLARKPEGKRPLGRPRRRWEDGIRMDFRKIGSSWLRIGPVASSCKYSDESSGSGTTEFVNIATLTDWLR